MELTPEKLIEMLEKREPLPNVILMYGEENYYRSKAAGLIKKYVFGDVPAEDMEISVFDRDTDLKRLNAAVNTYPFFGGSSLVIISDEKIFAADKKQKENLEALLLNVPEFCHVFINVGKMDKRGRIYKKLLADGACAECKALKPYQLKPWLDAEAKKRGCRFEYEAEQTVMEYLSAAETAPLLLLEQEIEKLFVYAGERRIWTKADVEAVFSALPEVSRFALLNAIALKNLPDALELLQNEKKHGGSAIAVAGLIAFQVRRLAQVEELAAQGMNQQAVAAAMKTSPYAVKKLMEQCRNYTAQDLSAFMLALADFNANIRYGGRQFEMLEEILIRFLGRR